MKPKLQPTLATNSRSLLGGNSTFRGVIVADATALAACIGEEQHNQQERAEKIQPFKLFLLMKSAKNQDTISLNQVFHHFRLQKNFMV